MWNANTVTPNKKVSVSYKKITSNLSCVMLTDLEEEKKTDENSVKKYLEKNMILC